MISFDFNDLEGSIFSSPLAKNSAEFFMCLRKRTRKHTFFREDHRLIARAGGFSEDGRRRTVIGPALITKFEMLSVHPAIPRAIAFLIILWYTTPSKLPGKGKTITPFALVPKGSQQKASYKESVNVRSYRF